MGSLRSVLISIFCLGFSCNSYFATEGGLGGHRAKPMTIVHSQLVPTLDPHLHETLIGHSVLSNLYEKLVSFDADSRLVPQLSVGWENPEPTVWQFELRQGVSFHDGRTLTVDDVVASLERARSHPQSGVANYLVSVREIEALDSKRILIRTLAPDPILLNKLAFIAVVPADAGVEIRSPVGTGPYRMREFKPHDRLCLSAFEGYWGGRAPESEVDILFRADAGERGRLLLEGEADLITDLPVEFLFEAEDRDDLWVDSRVSQGTRFLMLNINEPPFSDPRVREALDLALDRESLARDLMRNHARPAGQLVGPETTGYSSDLLPTRRDLARAKALLAEAGYPGGLEVSLPHGSGVSRLGDAIATQISQAGFRCRTRPLPWPELIDLMKREQPAMALFGFSNASNDAGVFFDAVVHSSSRDPGYGGLNFLGFSDLVLDRLIEASDHIMEPTERQAILRQISSRLAQQRAFLPLIWQLDLYGTRSDLVWDARQDGYVLAYEARFGRRI